MPFISEHFSHIYRVLVHIDSVITSPGSLVRGNMSVFHIRANIMSLAPPVSAKRHHP